MAAGTAILWKATLQINAQHKGFNEQFWLPDMLEADAKTAALAIAAQRKLTLPTDCEIFFAKIAKNDTKRDSRYLSGAIGTGSYQDPGSPATDAQVDYEKTSLLVRFENDNGTAESRKFSCLPDKIVLGGDLVSTITAVTARPSAVPAANESTDTWYQKMERLLKLIAFYCAHVDSDHLPGGAYTYYRYSAAYPLRIAAKKGARLFA